MVNRKRLFVSWVLNAAQETHPDDTGSLGLDLSIRIYNEGIIRAEALRHLIPNIKKAFCGSCGARLQERGGRRLYYNII